MVHVREWDPAQRPQPGQLVERERAEVFIGMVAAGGVRSVPVDGGDGGPVRGVPEDGAEGGCSGETIAALHCHHSVGKPWSSRSRSGESSSLSSRGRSGGGGGEEQEQEEEGRTNA